MTTQVLTSMWPLITIAVETRSEADAERLRLAIAHIAREDPSFETSFDSESGQTILHGDDELSLDHKLDLLLHTYGVGMNIGAPQVAYRDSITRKAEIDYTHKKLTGGAVQFARVVITFEPGEPGTGYVFESAVITGAVPKKYIQGVNKGIESAKENGLLAGVPVIDFKATLTDAVCHPIDSSVFAFAVAARAAFKALREKGGPTRLEPIMKVEVVTPEDCLASVIGDLNGRRGMIQGQDRRGNAMVVDAFVPLANMFGYVNTLRGMSQGRAQFTMVYDHYAEVEPKGPPDDVFPQAIGMRA